MPQPAQPSPEQNDQLQTGQHLPSSHRDAPEVATAAGATAQPPAPGRPRLWTPLFTAMAVANFGIFVIFYMLTSTLSGWMMDSMGASQSTAGAVSTCFFVGAVAARLLYGWLARAWGERAIVVGSAVALFLLCLAYPLAHSALALGLLRLVHGLAYGIDATASTGAALSRVPSTRRGEGSGWVSFGMALATGLAPFVGGWLERTQGEQAVFWCCAACAGVGLLLSVLVSRRLDATRARTHGSLHLADLVERRAIPAGVMVLCCAVPFGAVLTLVAPYGRAIGLGGAAGYYFLVYASVIVVSRPIAGILQDRLGDTRLLPIFLVSAALGLLLTGLAHSGPVLLLGGALMGLGYGTLVPSGQTVAINRAGSARAGVALASFFVLCDGGTGIGPFLFGSLVPVIGYRGVFLAGAVLAALGLAVVPRVRRQRLA